MVVAKEVVSEIIRKISGIIIKKQKEKDKRKNYLGEIEYLLGLDFHKYPYRIKDNKAAYKEVLKTFNEFVLGDERLAKKEHLLMKEMFTEDFKKRENLDLERAVDSGEIFLNERKWFPVNFRAGPYKRFEGYPKLLSNEAALKIVFPSGAKRIDIYSINEDGSFRWNRNVFYFTPMKSEL